MHWACLVLIQLLILQNVLSKERTKEDKITDLNGKTQEKDSFHDISYMLIEYKQHSITSIWNNVKNSALIAWNFVKSVANNTKEKIKTWVLDLKARAITLAKAFEENLRKLRERFNATLQNILGDENFQRCMQAENEKINIKFVEILQRVTDCIMGKMTGLESLDNFQMDDTFDEAKFMESIDSRLALCAKEKQVKECYQKVQDSILKDTETKEDKLLKTRAKSRSFTDDMTAAIVKCSTNGLIEASTVILTAAINVLNCISQVP